MIKILRNKLTAPLKVMLGLSNICNGGIEKFIEYTNNFGEDFFKRFLGGRDVSQQT